MLTAQTAANVSSSALARGFIPPPEIRANVQTHEQFPLLPAPRLGACVTDYARPNRSVKRIGLCASSRRLARRWTGLVRGRKGEGGVLYL